MVLRDWKGKVMDGLAKSVHNISSSLQGELFAIKEAYLFLEAYLVASALGLLSTVVESDNKEPILLSVSELVPPWEVSALEIDIHFNAQQIGAAHSIAALALKGLLLLCTAKRTALRATRRITEQAASVFSTSTRMFRYTLQCKR